MDIDCANIIINHRFSIENMFLLNRKSRIMKLWKWLYRAEIQPLCLCRDALRLKGGKREHYEAHLMDRDVKATLSKMKETIVSTTHIVEEMKS